MQLIGSVDNGHRHIGAVEVEVVRDLGYATDFYADWHATMRRCGDTFRLDKIEAVPAVSDSARVFFVGINYHSHAGEGKEHSRLDVPNPLIFGRWQQSLITEAVTVPAPPNDRGFDGEVELAAVVGERVWAGTEKTAIDGVLGYAANDLSARRKQLGTSQVTWGKNSDKNSPNFAITTADTRRHPGQPTGNDAWQRHTHAEGATPAASATVSRRSSTTSPTC
ncbi:fumarylacetoacetase-like protein [Arthrobacter sp. SLBN-100]|uniref:fumarylacetoacetate hydrolase family protein n=1 Tax=Arthrobacter sp. SLBN-100 TaxID=2768450 RepID=UPI0011509F06|nr:fumarylacetoacetate hydrolase family protein [Arthrobacter sp. SLBN-100]TQJ62216.1 fumarylacetoacetase-like protein [Arthrobacter sp. SLBN-100]